MLKHSQFNVMIIADGINVMANTLTGAIVELTKTEYDAFQHDLNQLSENDVTYLKGEGFLVENNLNEIGLLRNAYEEKKYLNDTANIVIGITLECNFCCPYCFEKRCNGYMSGNVQKKLIKYIDSLLENGIKELHIDWFGGEPLLYPDIIIKLSARINEICHKKNILVTYSLTTNGYSLNRQTAIKLMQRGVSTIKLTLDGNKEIHDSRRKLRSGIGTFDKILENINMIQDLSLSIIVRVNIDKSNKKSYTDVLNILADYKNVKVYPAIVTFEEIQDKTQKSRCYSHKEYDEYYRNAQNIGSFYKLDSELNRGVCSCMAEHKYSFVIDPSGYVYKCVNDIGQENSAIGSVIDNEYRGVSAVAKYLGRDPFTENECKNCPYIPLCYGGCLSEYVDKGTHACPPIKYLFKELVIQNILEKRKEANHESH